MKRDVIGISLGYNTSACVINPKDGIKLAISEERLNGEKNTKQFPINALKQCVKLINPKKGQLHIGISSYEVINDRTLKYFPESAVALRGQYDDFFSFLKDYIRFECNIGESVEIVLRRAEHHESHMLPSLYMSGFLLDPVKTISVTYDGFGDGVCATIVDHSTNEILAREYIENSLGLVYQYVTGALGFKEHQHEGKITGLAAFGDPKYIDVFEDFFIDYDKVTKSFVPNYLTRGWVDNSFDEINTNIHGFKNMLRLKSRVYEFVNHLMTNANATKEDIAATVQEYTEKLISQWIYDKLQENNINKCNIVLSGGVFSNVKLNYRIKKVVNPNNLFVLPPMGDEGTAIGAAISLLKELSGSKGINLEAFGKDRLYLGSTESGRKLDSGKKGVIDHNKYNVQEIDFADSNIVKLIAEFLANKKIVCVSRGYSEFGPRALGNHSILYDAGEKETNDSLNEKLNRTEFMPFAPITIDVYKDDLFLDTAGLDKTLKYMTIAVPVTEEFKEGYKAAYHIDNTARPQVMHYTDNPIIYSIIYNYSKLSNKKALINTSFNLHNSPIIYDDVTAYESFVKADLDVLLLKDKLIVKRGL
jgi:carbamoyltransferase